MHLVVTLGGGGEKRGGGGVVVSEDKGPGIFEGLSLLRPTPSTLLFSNTTLQKRKGLGERVGTSCAWVHDAI